LLLRSQPTPETFVFARRTSAYKPNKEVDSQCTQ
jgi:hypothetical protein